MSNELDRARTSLLALNNNSTRKKWLGTGTGTRATGLKLSDFIVWSFGAANFELDSDDKTLWESIKPGIFSQGMPVGEPHDL